ncbi:MAG: RluA family pseudouridine synthase [Polyangiales bacterium]
MSARRLSFVAQSDDAGERVDRVLAARLGDEGVNRSLAGRLCDEGRVTLRGQSLKASARLKAGDEVEVEVPPPEPLSAAPEDIPLDVVFEDEHLLVVDKPAGLVVHPARGHASGTLVNAVAHRVSVDDDGDPLRPGIVHRIDRDTSGLLVVARTAEAREGLTELFRRHDIERRYAALVEGVPPSPVTWRTAYGRHPTDRMKFSSKVREGREAVTHAEVVERLAGGRASLVRCTLETGRTHQIRVHLSDAGFPIVADAMYGRAPRWPPMRAVAAALGRQALHAEVLGFVHPCTGRALRFESPLPTDLATALASLRALDPHQGE